MPLSKCPRCKSLWNRDREAVVCEACAPDEDADREKVLEFIGNNPGKNSDEIADATEVDVETIRRMLDEGVLSREIDLGPAICGQCGAKAISHTQLLCDKCLAAKEKEVLERRKTLQSAINETKFGDRSNDLVGEKSPAESKLSAREVLKQKRQ